MLSLAQAEDAPELYVPQAITLAEVQSYAEAHNLGLLDEHRAVDAWLQCGVDPRDLRDKHAVFGRGDEAVQLEKGRRFVELLERFRTQILDGHFPCAAEIRDSWPNEPRIVVQQTLRNGLLYVADGEKRRFNALSHDETRVRAYIVPLDQEREVL